MYKSTWKAVAIRVTDASAMDETGYTILKNFYTQMELKGRFIALLDPCPAVELLLKQFNDSSSVPIFGTESAFEEHAFSKRNTTTWKPKIK